MAARKSTELKRAVEALKAQQKAELAGLRLAHGIQLEQMKRSFAPAVKPHTSYKGFAPKRSEKTALYRGFAAKRTGPLSRAPAKPKREVSYRGFYER